MNSIINLYRSILSWAETIVDASTRKALNHVDFGCGKSCDIAKSVANCLITFFFSDGRDARYKCLQPLSRFAREPNSSSLHQLYQNT